MLTINIQLSLAVILLHCTRQCIKVHATRALPGTIAEHVIAYSQQLVTA